MTTPGVVRHNRYGPVAALLLALALAAGAATVVLFLKGALGHDSSALCGAADSEPASCALDVQANQRQQDLVVTLALATGAAAAVLAGGATVVALAGRSSR